MSLIDKQGKYYIAHLSFSGFTQSLFFTYGALLLYAHSQSILLTILYMLVAMSVSTSLRSIGLRYFFKLVEKVGSKTVIILGLLSSAFAFILIYSVTLDHQLFYFSFILAAILHGLGEGLYWTISDAVRYQLIGQAKQPGRYASIISIARELSALLAAVVGLFVGLEGAFSSLFLVGCLMLVISTIPLKFIDLPKMQGFSFKQCLGQIEPRTFWANFAPHYRFQRLLLPLVLLFLFMSMDTSIWIVGITAFFSIIAAWGTGFLKDSHSNLLNYAAFVILPLIWILFGFAENPKHFIVLGVFLSVFTTIMVVGRDVRMSREIFKSGTPLGAAIAFDFARSLGGLVGAGVILLLYLISQSVRQEFLMIAAIFTLYPAWYAASLTTAVKK